MRFLLFSFLLLTFTSCLPKEVEQSTNTNISKWDRSFPIALSISDDFDFVEMNEIRTSSNSWDTALNSSVTLMDNSGTTTSKSNDLRSYQDGVMGIYKIYSWPSDLPDSALAVTQLFGTRRNIGSSDEYIQINHADILVNYDSSFEYYTTYGYDLQSVITHEMGHFLGLLHENSSPSQSVMFPSISRWTPNREPKDNDIASLRNLYDFNSGSVTVASRGLASSQSNTTDTQAVVILFEARADGKENITVRDAKSNKIISQDTVGCEHSK